MTTQHARKRLGMDEGEARRVQPKVALVMGAARGMGGAIAERLAQEGADVAVADRRDTRLQDTARAVTALGRRTVALSVEVTDTAQVEQVGPDAPGCSGPIVDR